MNLQQFLEEVVAPNQINNLPILKWLFVRDHDRDEFLRKLKREGLVDREVTDLDDALIGLGFKVVEKTAPTSESAYEMPSEIDIDAVMRAHRMSK